MRILISDPGPLGDRVASLQRCGCSAHAAGHNTVEAAPPQRPMVDSAYLRMELDAYLRVWREMHPDVHAELLQPPGP